MQFEAEGIDAHINATLQKLQESLKTLERAHKLRDTTLRLKAVSQQAVIQSRDALFKARPRNKNER